MHVRRIPTLLAFLAMSASSCVLAQTPGPALADLVRQVSRNEAAAAHHRPDYFFIQEERSDRTGQHLWVEAIAETPHGPLRRLLTEDGHPLDPDRRRQVDARVAALAANPSWMDSVNRSRMQDQNQGEALLALTPEMFLYSDEGRSVDSHGNAVLKLSYRPNPAYQPANYQERVLHATAGTILVEEPTLRLLALDGSLTGQVKFAYGLLGSIESGKVHLVRLETSHGDYKPQALDLSVDGHILLFHTLGRQEHVSRKGFVLMGDTATLDQALKMVMAAKVE